MKPNGYWQYDSRNREFISPNGRRFDIFQMVEWLNSPDGRPTAATPADRVLPCDVCRSPTEYEAQDKPLCHRCAVVILEYVRSVDFIHAFDDACECPIKTSKVELPEGGKMLACCRHDFPLGTCYICK